MDNEEIFVYVHVPFLWLRLGSYVPGPLAVYFFRSSASASAHHLLCLLILVDQSILSFMKESMESLFLHATCLKEICGYT